MPDPAPFGILPVDKPAGPTSHDAVDAVRKALGLRRVGHSGTLDPFAEGVLLMGVGPAVRCLAHLPDWPKTYEATARLGVTTDTDDGTGKPLATKPVPEFAEERVKSALAAFRGTIQQIPPAFAAVKIRGERAYAKARRGETPELKAREVRVESIELVEFTKDAVRFRVRCGAGTYIRSICRDLGGALGCGAHCAALVRTAIGPFARAEAVRLADLTAETARAGLRPLVEVFSPDRIVTIPAEEIPRIRRGRAWDVPADPAPSPAAASSRLAVDAAGVPVAIVLRRGRSWRPEVVFPSQ